MQESDLPEGTASSELSFEQGVEALEGILGAPDEEPAKSPKSSNTEDDPEGDSADVEMSDEEPETDEESDEPDEDEDQDESGDDELPDDLEIDLGNGQRATLAQLKEAHLHADKRVKDMQRDYTQKTQELSQRNSHAEQQEQRILQFANETAQMRQRFLETVSNFLPEPPQLPRDQDDPVAWADYSRDKALYDQRMGHYRQILDQQEQQRQQQLAQQQGSITQWAQGERERFLEAHPELRDQQQYQKVNAEICKVFKESYGIQPHELQGIYDSRMLNAMMDVLAYHKGRQKLQSSKVTAREKMAGKPKMLTSGKARKMGNSNSRRRQQADAALRKTGSLEAGVAAILAMDDEL